MLVTDRHSFFEIFSKYAESLRFLASVRARSRRLHHYSACSPRRVLGACSARARRVLASARARLGACSPRRVLASTAAISGACSARARRVLAS